MARVMAAWGALSDLEYLAWHVAADSRRKNRVGYFKEINLPRAWRGEQLLRLPPPSQPFDGQPVLKGLDIGNPGGPITLKLEFWRMPTAPMTVWAGRPFNRGRVRPAHCPRLGALPAPVELVSDITRLYDDKHGEYIREHGVELAGKRIVIRVRQELDGGPDLYEQVSAVVPEPPGRAARQKKTNPFEAPP